MAKYVYLISWTPQGIQNVKETTKRAKQAQQGAKALGGSLDLYWTMGRYDLVCIGEFPDDETSSVFSLQVSMQGSVQIETLRAFTSDEVDGLLAKLG